MCGVIGVIGSPDAAKETFLGLITLQHRGQDAAGILSYDRSFHEVKNIGLVENVFSRQSIETLTGSMAIGHTRYSTIGNGDLRDVQPFVLNYPYGIGLVHNGNLVNYLKVKEKLTADMKRICLSQSDSETILNWIAHQMDIARQKVGDSQSFFDQLRFAAQSVFESIEGSFSIVGLVAAGGLYAMRDPHGLRPLVIGKRTTDRHDGTKGQAYMVASESVSLNVAGYEYVRDVYPGELIYIDQRAQTLSSYRHKIISHRPCMFEWVYFASAESEMEQTPVYSVRLALGRALAKDIRRRIESGEIEADLVAPVPDTSRTAAAALAEELRLPYREVLIKNRYIKRTFILSSQAQRERSVDLKLNPVFSEIRGKSILLVDDSIVRGTTSKKIIDLVKKAGAKKVYFLSTCPPIRFPCFYGIDFPDQRELIAAGKSEQEISLSLGADGVYYLDQESLVSAILTSENKVGKIEIPSNGAQRSPCTACLDGLYPTDISESRRFANLRIDQRKGARP